MTNPFEKIFELFLHVVPKITQHLDDVERVQIAPFHVETVATTHASTEKYQFQMTHLLTIQCTIQNMWKKRTQQSQLVEVTAKICMHHWNINVSCRALFLQFTMYRVHRKKPDPITLIKKNVSKSAKACSKCFFSCEYGRNDHDPLTVLC